MHLQEAQSLPEIMEIFSNSIQHCSIPLLEMTKMTSSIHAHLFVSHF